MDSRVGLEYRIDEPCAVRHLLILPTITRLYIQVDDRIGGYAMVCSSTMMAWCIAGVFPACSGVSTPTSAECHATTILISRSPSVHPRLVANY